MNKDIMNTDGLIYEIWHSRVPNLTWTHIRHLLRVTDEKARQWYMQEASTQLWSTLLG